MRQVGASSPMTAHRRLAGAGSRPQSGACLEAGMDGWPLVQARNHNSKQLTVYSKR